MVMGESNELYMCCNEKQDREKRGSKVAHYLQLTRARRAEDFGLDSNGISQLGTRYKFFFKSSTKWKAYRLT